MDFSNRNAQSPLARPAGTEGHSGQGGHSSKKPLRPKYLNAFFVIMLFGATILVVALVFLFSVGNNDPSKYLNKKLMQAVFLNNGQVYFGNISALNGKTIDLTNIYYLRSDSTDNNTSANTNNNISLVKLGCELHGPTDQMVINMDQVTFWENLKSDGQVTKAVAQYEKDNPGAQQCKTTSGSSDQAPSGSNNSSTNNSTTNNSTTNNSTTKKP